MNSSIATKGRLVSLADQLRSTRQPGQVVLMVSVDFVSPNPRQPRKTFNAERMEELAGSVRKNGIKQPIRVTLISPGQYELASGERRWRAAKMAGLKEVPTIVDDKLDDREKLRLALVENLDRDDMTPVDEARGVADWSPFPASWKSPRSSLARSSGSRNGCASPRPRDYVHAFAESAAIGDLEAIYELAKFSDDSPEEAQRLIAEYEPGSHLRAQLKAAQRPLTDHGTAGEPGDAEGTQDLADGALGSLRAPRTSPAVKTTAKGMARAPAAPPACSRARRAARPTFAEWGGTPWRWGCGEGDEDKVSHAKLSEGRRGRADAHRSGLASQRRRSSSSPPRGNTVSSSPRRPGSSSPESFPTRSRRPWSQ